VFYGAAVTEAKAMAGQRVAVVGGANSAGQAAVHLARHAQQVTLLVRGNALAEGMSAYLVQELQRAGNLTVRLGNEVTEVHGAGRLETLTIKDGATKSTEILRAAALFIMIGHPTRPPIPSGTLGAYGRAEPHSGCWSRRRAATDASSYGSRDDRYASPRRSCEGRAPALKAA
jgi:thioredoxin reductase (NADPH)